jgi:hypothetical protein
MTRKVKKYSLDLPMDDTESKSEEISDTLYNKEDVYPHDHVKEEVVIPLDIDKEESKEHVVAPQDSVEMDYNILSYLS